MSLRLQDITELLPESLSDIHRGAIAAALLSTLTTVKFSNNLTPPIEPELSPSDDNSLIYINNITKNPSHWATFVRQRAWAASPKSSEYMNQFLATTWHKSEQGAGWQTAAKIVGKKHAISFDSDELSELFKKLEKQSPNNERAFLCSLIIARQERAGNCGVLAYNFLYALWGLALSHNIITIDRIEVVSFKDVDHSFVLINRYPTSDINDYNSWSCSVIDAWCGLDGQPVVIPSEQLSEYIDKLCTSRPDIFSVYDEDHEQLFEVEFSIEQPSKQSECFDGVGLFLNSYRLETVAAESGPSKDARLAHAQTLKSLHQVSCDETSLQLR